MITVLSPETNPPEPRDFHCDVCGEGDDGQVCSLRQYGLWMDDVNALRHVVQRGNPIGLKRWLAEINWSRTSLGSMGFTNPQVAQQRVSEIAEMLRDIAKHIKVWSK